MKEIEREVLSIGDAFYWRRHRSRETGPHEVVHHVRISPISYRMGERAGFQVGLVAGFTVGMLFMCLVFANMAKGQEPPTKPTLEHTEVDAVVWAFQALLSYPPEDLPFMRFVYFPPWADPEWPGIVDYAVNAACSQTPVLYRGDSHAGGWLRAYNLRKYAPNPKQLARLIEVWDGLASSESKFHVPDFNVAFIVCTRCKGGGRLTYNYGEDDCDTCQGTGKIRRRKVAYLAPHLEEALLKHVVDPSKSKRVDEVVALLTKSSGAIYPADFLLEQLLTSARGKYPEFRQIQFKSPSPLTPFQAHLKKRGFFPEQSAELRGDKGALLLVSGVTGKSRIVMTIFGLASRRPMVTTFDFKDSRIRPDQQFIRNIIEFQPFSDANETFVPMSNGLIEFLISNGKGEFIRVVPPDIAVDYTKPDGHTKELEMGMSCILCHANENGYKTASNDMEFLLGADTDFFGEDFSYTRNGKKITLNREETVALVASRFGERIDEPDGILGRARRDYIRSVGTLIRHKVTADGPTAVQQVGIKLKQIYHAYRYAKVDARQACRELGVNVPEGQGRAVLRRLVPPPTAGEREDIVIALLRNGAQIKRDDMSAIYAEMARRAVLNRDQFKETKE